MSESKHTPGPWSLSGGEHGEWRISAPDAEGVDGWGVGMTFGAAGFHGLEGEAESEANARLIAAAPDLLAALKALRNECSGTPRPWLLVDLLTDATAAIAAAEGRS